MTSFYAAVFEVLLRSILCCNACSSCILNSFEREKNNTNYETKVLALALDSKPCNNAIAISETVTIRTVIDLLRWRVYFYRPTFVRLIVRHTDNVFAAGTK